jgi:hypothetical protein
MEKLKFQKTLIILTLVVGIALTVVSCGPTYVRGDYGYRSRYNYPPRRYRYVVPPSVIVVPRYCPPPRRGYYGRGNGRSRRW